MKKKLLAALLAAAMLTGLASATFASSNVTDSNQVDLTVAANTVTVKVYETAQIEATATGRDLVEDTALTANIAYTSNDAAIATVDAEGTVTGVAAGETTVTVTATAGKATAIETVTVTVTPPEEQTVTSVKIAAPTSTTPAPGTQFTLTAEIVTSDGEAYTGTDKKWEITPATEGVTVVDGKVTIASTVATGTVFTVKYTAGGKEASVKFTVTAATTDDGNNGGSTGGSTGGGSSSSGGTTTTTPAEETVSTTEAVAKVEQAIAAADADATVVVVRIRNAKSITAAALKAVLKAAVKAEKAPIVHADVTKDGKVESRLYIDPSLMKGNGEIKLGVTLGDEKVTTKFDKYFKNDIAVVKFDQTGSFGMSIKAAVKLDLSKLDTKALVFYSYNPKTNTYTKMTAPNYRIDANGYLHFTTSMGNCVIVTDQPLARK